MRLNQQQMRAAKTLVKVLAVACSGYVVWENVRVWSLNSWARTVQRPGFVLLHKEQSPTRFLALFQTADGRLAVCDLPIGTLFYSSPLPTSIGIRNADGQDAIDGDSSIEVLSRDSWYGPFPCKVNDGTVIRLRNADGPIRVLVSESGEVSSDGLEFDDSSPQFSFDVDWAAAVRTRRKH